MKKSKRIVVGMLIGLLQLIVMLNPLTVSAQTSTGSYTINVSTPGTFGQVLLLQVDNWSDVIDLTIIGHLNASDMAYFSRLRNMKVLNVSQTDITSICGCNDLSLLEEIVLPESVTKIGAGAFSNCTALKSIALDNIEEIGENAFSQCECLSGNLNGPKVKNIGARAFYRCDNIESISFPMVEEIYDEAFAAEENESVTKLSTANISNVKYLGADAFANCKSLKFIDISKCDKIGISKSWRDGCFVSCSSLSDVILSDNLESIPNNCFKGTALQSITLPSNLKTIGDGAFSNTGITDIVIPEGVEEIGNEAFDCPLVNVTLPSTLESIGNNAFYYVNKEYLYTLKNVYCKSVVPIVTSAFNNDMAKEAILHVPAISVAAYKLDENWYLFNKIEPLSGELTDITINNNFTILDYTGFANNANLTLTSSKTQNTAGHLTIAASSPLELGSFVQYQNTVKWYYYGDQKFPYSTTLIGENVISANEVKLIISVKTDEWNFISFPFDVNVSDIKMPESTLWVIRKYSGLNRAMMNGDTWLDVDAGSILKAYEGYILHCTKTDSDNWNSEIALEVPAVNNSNKNNIFNNEDVTINLNDYPSKYDHNSSWNLIGNPYPAYINIQNLEFDAPITVWNGDGYTAYSPLDDSYYLKPNESFFVQRSSSYPAIVFDSKGRTHNTEDSADSTRMSISPKDKIVNPFSDRKVLNFYLSGNNYVDKTRLVINSEAKAGYEPAKDASKFLSSNKLVPQLYFFNDDVRFSINECPVSDGYMLGVYVGEMGEYTLSLETSSDVCKVLLIDNETGIETEISKGSYKFVANKGFNNSRFLVRVSNEQSGIEEVPVDEPDFSGAVYNFRGQKVDSDSKGLLIINGKKVIK